MLATKHMALSGVRTIGIKKFKKLKKSRWDNIVTNFVEIRFPFI